MPEDAGAGAGGFFLGLIIRPNYVVVARVFRFDLGFADNDITERCYPVPLLGPFMAALDLDAKNLAELGHAEGRLPEVFVLEQGLKALGFRDSSLNNVPEMKNEHLGFPFTTCLKYYPEIKKEDLEALGFHFISFPKNVPEITKEGLEALGLHLISYPSNVLENKKEYLEALGIHFITCPKDAPGTQKECPELWRFHIATYPKIVGMPRISPWLHALGASPTSGNWMDAEFIVYLDSGAGHHVVHQAEMLINLRAPPPGLTHVKAADGALLKVSGFGDIQTRDFSIPDVCLVEGLMSNLVSVGQLVSSRKISCNFNWDGCDVISYDDGSLVGSAVLRGVNQYVLSFLNIQ